MAKFDKKKFLCLEITPKTLLFDGNYYLKRKSFALTTVRLIIVI